MVNVPPSTLTHGRLLEAGAVAFFYTCARKRPKDNWKVSSSWWIKKPTGTFERPTVPHHLWEGVWGLRWIKIVNAGLWLVVMNLGMMGELEVLKAEFLACLKVFAYPLVSSNPNWMALDQRSVEFLKQMVVGTLPMYLLCSINWIINF